MKNLKKLAATLTLTGIIMMGVSNTNAGILMSDFTGKTACSEIKVDHGIIMSDFTAIIMSGFTGIIMSDFTGILIGDLSASKRECVKVDNGILLGD